MQSLTRREEVKADAENCAEMSSKRPPADVLLGTVPPTRPL